MIKNLLTTAWRNLWNNKSFSTLNILGLALGMACSLLILFWVQDERSIDAFHIGKDRLYVLYEREFADGKISGDYEVPARLGEELKKSIPEVQYAMSSDWSDQYTFRAGNKTIKENGAYAGEDFFNLFSFPLLQGKSLSALSEPLSIAISRSMATRFFGSPAAAMGKTMRRDNAKDFTVTAVFDDVPENSSLKFDFMLSWKAYFTDYPWMDQWGNSGPLTVIQLKEGADAGAVKAKVKNFMARYGKPDPGHRVELGMQRFDERYLHSNFKNGEISGGRIEYVHLFSIVAVFILLIACINFMNLTTARSIKRAREIGVRKVVGAMRGSLIGQFIGEALLQAFVAVGVALLLVSILLPLFNGITGKQMVLPVSQLAFWLELASLAMVTGFISGSYPAFFLSSFQPVKVLKGTMKFGSGAVFFRRGLVVFQFVLSIVLINCTIIVSQQVKYIQTRNLGYNRENLLYIPLDGELLKRYDLFKQEAVKLAGIRQVTRMSNAPTVIDNGTVAVEWEGKAPDLRPSFFNASVGYDFARTMQLQVLEGHDFVQASGTDSAGYLINEKAALKIGYKHPVGSPLTFWGRKGTIIGIIKDFHFASLHDPIGPLILRFGENDTYGSALIRTEPGKTKQVLANLELLCKQLNPAFPFSYQFSDVEYQKLYKSEEVIGKLSNGFAFLAIFISCLGLLGLAMFTAEQRTKEMGVRKVLGARIGQVVTLLSGDFLLLVFIALLIASPLAWWAMNEWLQDYTYRVQISGWVFLAGGVLAVAIALATVSYQAIRVALANPVKSLRSE
ncbi:MAG TPA: ABC transporter permease [Puia sp.]|nr:ABC transporter permease [Puia sp.]